MGAWGTGVYDNDMALDFELILIAEAFKKAELNEDFLVIADLISKGCYIPKINESAKIVQVIKDEIANLDSWKEEKREERKELLLNLLQKSTFVYINKRNDEIIYPYKVYDNECKTQCHLKCGGVICEWWDIDGLNNSHNVLLDHKFKIHEDGLDIEEVEEYFKNLE